MTGPCPATVTLAREVRQRLERVCRRVTCAQREVLRARIVLLAADGHTNAEIGTRLAVTVFTVRKWRGRFSQRGICGLLDHPRRGRPCRFDSVTRSELISLACRPVPPEPCRSQSTRDELLARRYPHQTVHVVWDNLNTHRGAHHRRVQRKPRLAAFGSTTPACQLVQPDRAVVLHPRPPAPSSSQLSRRRGPRTAGAPLHRSLERPRTQTLSVDLHRVFPADWPQR